MPRRSRRVTSKTAYETVGLSRDMPNEMIDTVDNQPSLSFKDFNGNSVMPDASAGLPLARDGGSWGGGRGGNGMTLNGPVDGDGGGDHRRGIRVTPPHRYNSRNVIQEPLGRNIGPMGDFLISYATVADDLPAWGANISGRDRQLRQFWPSETMTASAMYSMVSKYASFEWTLEGPPRLVGEYQRILNGVESGEGWIAFQLKGITDLLSQDNGQFIELIRTDDDASAPCVSMEHLDANRCIRTGHRATPVMYYDSLGAGHLMAWYQVIALSEFPSPIEFMRGIQLCAISRLLRAAQIMRDISIYKREKISGRFNRSIYFVSGPQQRSITDALENQRRSADAEGLTRYLQPLIIASLDPGASVKVDKIDLASLPDNFNEEEAMRWFVAQLALAFGGDYADFAPLPTSTNGSSSSTRMMHQKSLSKGSRLFMKMQEQMMNFRGIIPTNVRFSYAETDPQEDQQRGDLKLTRAKERQIRILSGEVTVPVARQIAADDGDLDYGLLLKMNKDPLNQTVAIPAWTPMESDPNIQKVDDPKAYEGTGDDEIPGATNWGAGTNNGGDKTTTSPVQTPAQSGATVKRTANMTRGRKK